MWLCFSLSLCKHCRAIFDPNLIFIISFAIYPLFKRFTYWPQAWLGIAMNFGFITAWISITGSMDTHLILAAMTACWW